MEFPFPMFFKAEAEAVMGVKRPAIRPDVYIRFSPDDTYGGAPHSMSVRCIRPPTLHKATFQRAVSAG